MRLRWRSGNEKTVRPSFLEPEGEFGGLVAVAFHQARQLGLGGLEVPRPGAAPFRSLADGEIVVDGVLSAGSAASWRRRGRPCARPPGRDDRRRRCRPRRACPRATRLSRKTRQWTGLGSRDDRLHDPSLADLLVARVEKQIADLAQGAVAPGFSSSSRSLANDRLSRPAHDGLGIARMYISATASMTARQERRPRSKALG